MEISDYTTFKVSGSVIGNLALVFSWVWVSSRNQLLTHLHDPSSWEAPTLLVSKLCLVLNTHSFISNDDRRQNATTSYFECINLYCVYEKMNHYNKHEETIKQNNTKRSWKKYALPPPMCHKSQTYLQPYYRLIDRLYIYSSKPNQHFLKLFSFSSSA